MNGIRSIKIPFVFAFLLGVPFAVEAQNTGTRESVDFSHTLDWERSELRIEAEVKLEDTDLILPAARQRAEELVEGGLLFAFNEAIAGMTVDSRFTVAEQTGEEPGLIEGINRLSRNYERTFSRISPDLTSFSLTYTYKLFPDIVTLFIKHQEPYRPPRVLEHVPTAEFTGIVIYAKGSLPVHGERRREIMKPSLFPTLFDGEMREIYKKGMVAPDTLKKWGMAAYSGTLDESPYLERIGRSPLRILARGIFGINYTDLIIPVEAANRILYDPNNRRLLEEGRVLIVCDLP
ncbi:MAG: hypothetical protein ACOCX6_01600 [bacterium]